MMVLGGMIAAMIVLAGGCYGDHIVPDAPPSPCGTSAPMLQKCVPHGLAITPLTGMWSFTGTEVTTPIMPPGAMTTAGIDYTISFTVDGCVLGGESPSLVDDTNATADQLMEPGTAGLDGRAIGPATICGNGDGTLSFQWSKSYFEGMMGIETGYEDTGTLTRVGP